VTTVASRIVRSSPHRSTSATWECIVELLTQGKNDAARKELLAVEGVAASIISDKAPQDSAIVVSCDGPQTRVYCLYDEAALDESDAKEDALGYEPLKGNWAVSLPCTEADLAWVQRSLKAKSSRITARDMSTKLREAEDTTSSAKPLTIDLKAFLGS